MEELECEIELVEKLEWEMDEYVIKGERSELEKGFLREKIWSVRGGIFFGRENFGCLRGFWEIEEKFERNKILKKREFLRWWEFKVMRLSSLIPLSINIIKSSSSLTSKQIRVKCFYLFIYLWF